MNKTNNTYNFFLKLAYLFRRFRKRKIFSGEVTFEGFDGLKIVDHEFYNEHPVFFSIEAVTIGKDLKIVCKEQHGSAVTWQRSDKYTHVSGMVRTWGKNGGFKQPYGTWIVEAIIPESWAALWLLRANDCIIPEIDFAENNGHGIDNVIHWGKEKGKYTKHSYPKKMHRQDGKLHEYAVEVRPDGYSFYLDGYLINKFKGSGEFVSDAPLYLIINNATDDRFSNKNTELYIKSIKIIR